jgi:hypothetical protein
MALNEDDQMQAVFISTRQPVEVDPVSGNEVPPGSLPEEVRDDIPAQLSEGEYVVPADVLRFYGMKFFEDLRETAKIELARMDAEGRIGGEPVEPMQQDDLTPEEMAEIEKMTMAVGGFATQQPTQSTQPDPYQQQQMMYRQGAPVAMGNAGYDGGGQVRGYNSSSVVTPPPPPAAPPPPVTPVPANTQAQLDFSQFGAGFSFSPQAQDNLEQISQAAAPTPEFTPVTMYGPNNGKPVVEAKTLEQYNKLLAEGYTLTPPVIDNDDPDPPEEEKDPTAWADGLDFTDGEAVQASVNDMLGVTEGDKTIAGVSMIGAAFTGINRATGVARSRALADMIKDINPELSEALHNQINSVVEKSTFLKFIPDEVIDGDQILSQLQDKYGSTSKTIITSMLGLYGGAKPEPKPPEEPSGGGSGGSSYNPMVFDDNDETYTPTSAQLNADLEAAGQTNLTSDTSEVDFTQTSTGGDFVETGEDDSDPFEDISASTPPTVNDETI